MFIFSNSCKAYGQFCQESHPSFAQICWNKQEMHLVRITISWSEGCELHVFPTSVCIMRRFKLEIKIVLFWSHATPIWVMAEEEREKRFTCSVNGEAKARECRRCCFIQLDGWHAPPSSCSASAPRTTRLRPAAPCVAPSFFARPLAELGSSAPLPLRESMPCWKSAGDICGKLFTEKKLLRKHGRRILAESFWISLKFVFLRIY
jgi:hypothetical protein